MTTKPTQHGSEHAEFDANSKVVQNAGVTASVPAVAVETASTADRIRDRLNKLQPVWLELKDESGKHIGHAGARDGGGHYQLIIASPVFAGVSRIARHRMIYDALGDLMRREVHALAINAFAPDEL